MEQSGQWAWACEDHLHLPSKPIYALPGTPIRLTLMPEAGRDASLLVRLPTGAPSWCRQQRSAQVVPQRRRTVMAHSTLAQRIRLAMDKRDAAAPQVLNGTQETPFSASAPIELVLSANDRLRLSGNTAARHSCGQAAESNPRLLMLLHGSHK